MGITESIGRATLDLLVALSTNTALGWIVVVIIVGLAIFSLIRLRAINGSLASEMAHLRTTADELQEALGSGQSISDDQLWQRIHALPQGVTRIVLTTLQSVKRLPNPDLSLAINAASHFEARRLFSLRMLPNSLMMIGLFGTVVGLAGVVGTLSPQLDSALDLGNPTDLKAALGQTLAEMQTAFACTIYGVLFSLIVARALGSTSRLQSTVLQVAEEITIYEFAPILLPESQEAQIEDFRQVLRDSQRFLDDFRESVRVAADSFHFALMAAGETTRKSIEGLGDSTQNMKELLGDLNQGVASSSNALVSSSVSLATETANIKAIVSDSRNAVKKLKAFIESSIETDHVNRDAMLERFQEMSSALVTRVSASSSEATAFINQSKSYFESIREDAQMASAAHLDASRSVQAVVEGLDTRLGASVSRIATGMEEAQLRQRAILDSLSELPKVVDASRQIADAVASQASNLGHSLTQLSGYDPSRIEMQIREISDTLTRVSQLTETYLTSLHADSSSATRRQNDLTPVSPLPAPPQREH